VCVLLLKNAEAVVSVLLMRTDDMRLNFVQVEYVLLYCTHVTWCFGTPPPNEKSWFQYRTRRLPEASNCKILIGFSLSAVQISGRRGSGSSAFTGKPVTETKTPLSESPSASTSSRLAVLTRTGGKYALQKTKKSYPESRPRAGGAAAT
jgi:hypothetical protein